MTAEKEPDVQEMLAEMLAKAREEGRQSAFTEMRTFIQVTHNACERDREYAGKKNADIANRMQGRLDGLTDTAAWVIVTANGGEIPEELK